MTIICFDGRFVAADRSLSAHGGRAHWQVCKLKVVGDVVFALTGTGALFDPMIAWANAGAMPEAAPVAHDDDNKTQLIEFMRDVRVRTITIRLPHYELYRPPCAFGCEQEFAMGVMMAKETAIEAVRLAITRSNYCGGGIDYVDLEDSGPLTVKTLSEATLR